MSDGGEPRVFGDRYELVRHIARGGMARVYLAQDLLLDRPVALKVLFPELSTDQSFVQRFRREAQAAANLAHPNIVSIYDWGQGERTYYIVMEYVDGETLSARIRRGPLSPDQAAIVGISTAAALSFAHRRNVIHRDVKPGNVLIDRSGQVKVADFGIARAIGTSEDLTQAGAVMGTATYFSPEQAQGQAVDARSDVYSLGVVLYEMVAGRPPFQGDTPVAIAYKHVREAPPPPSQLRADLPAAFEAIVLKALAKEPADRYQDADELRADLEAFRSGRPVSAAAGAGVATTAMATAAPTRVTQRADPTTVAPVAATTMLGPDRPAPVPVADEGGSHWGRWLLAALAVLVIIALLVYFIGRDEGWFGAKTLTVPNVAGKTEKAAESQLRAEGFTSVGTRPVASSRYSTGDAVATDPGAGKRIASDHHLVLEVSSGPTMVAVPKVAGDSEHTAEAALKARGFKVAVGHSSSSTVAKGSVIRTDPVRGTSRPKGSVVRIVVSTGVGDIKVPSVQGDTPEAAGAKLEAAGLTVSTAPPTMQSSSSIPAGDVIGTNPPSGDLIAPTTPITIIVSSGLPNVTVPYVVGDDKSTASSILSGKGLDPTFTTTPVTSPGQNGKVQSTNPKAGASVPSGTPVTVVIGSYTAPPTTTSTSTTTIPVPPSSTPTTLPST